MRTDVSPFGPELEDEKVCLLPTLPHASKYPSYELCVAMSCRVNVPVASIPVASVPVANVPVSSVPVANVPVSSVPVASIPVAGIPVASVPVAGIPVANVPIVSVPVANVPVANVPIVSVPVANVPVANVPIVSVPVAIATTSCIQYVCTFNQYTIIQVFIFEMLHIPLAQLEEVYKAAVACLIGKTPIDNSLPKERHLRKVRRRFQVESNDLNDPALFSHRFSS